MKKTFFATFLAGFAVSGAFSLVSADSGLDVLLKNKKESLENSHIKERVLKLDDAYLIQSFSKLKSLNSTNLRFVQMMNHVFYHDYDSFLKNYNVEDLSSKERELALTTRLYVLLEKNLDQSFIYSWIKNTQNNKLHLDSELMLSLDRVVIEKGSEWLVSQGLFLTVEEKAWIKSTSSSSEFHSYMKAYASLREGEKSLGHIKKLEKGSTLSYQLAKSGVVDYARKGKLGEAGILLKNVIGPYLERTQNEEEIAAYYMDLGRLLFQAGAYKKSHEYYLKIPKKSSLFLQAKVESMWVLLASKNYSRLQGDIKSFDLRLFKNSFIPDAYLVSSVSHVKLCQFKETQSSFQSYIQENKPQIKLIKENLSLESPAEVTKNDFFINQLKTAQKNIKDTLSEFSKDKLLATELLELDIRSRKIPKILKKELRRKWVNREKLLNKSIFEMRFVKIEFLSRMRNLKNKMAKLKPQSDRVSTFQAKNAKNGELMFPYENVPFGDEVFNLRGDVYDLCLLENKK